MKNMSTMSHSMTEPQEIFIMMMIMFIAGLLSSMNIWVDKLSDISFHLNDIYMALLMCGWSLLLMGIYYININLFSIGIIMTIIILYCIRKQVFIDEIEYVKGMIPHHSMAVFMSKQLLEKQNNSSKIKYLATHIINTQENEIKFMNKRLQ